MRIVIVTSWPTDVVSGSGTAVFFNSLYTGLKERGYQLEIIAPDFDITDYVDVTLKRFLFNTELRTDPRLQNADLVIGFDYDGYGLDARTRPPMISSVHAIFGDVIQWETDPVRTMVVAQAFFDKVAMQQAESVIVGSQYAKDRVVALYGVDPGKVEAIPHGMAPPRWLALAQAEARPANDHPVLLTMGKMYPRKRTNILIEAVGLLREKYPTIELRIAGDGLEWERLHELADRIGVQQNISWLNFLAPTSAAYAHEWRHADIFCHPSCQETFGFVYLEAMMMGLPIVAARAGAAPEVLGDAGLLAAPEDPVSLAAEIERFLQSEDLRRDYGERAKIRSTRFTLQRMIDGYVRVIEELTTIS